jgi:predicted nuclease of restriction endonuclease-like RecB superfamily
MIFLGVEYRYEYKVFSFSNDDTYRPDFYLPHLNSWVEIKGHWFEEAIQKHLYFVNEYPEEVIYVIEQDSYRPLQRKFAKYIPNWEF